jgi:alpha,alpha-trehalase
LKAWIAGSVAIFAVARAVGFDRPPSPDEVYGALFADVQRAQVFADQKTFPDCVPREPPARILEDYRRFRCGIAGEPSTDELRRFVLAHFLVPETHEQPVPEGEPIERHIAALWDLLRRNPERAAPGSSILPLPRAYVVPGGRFREIYYWDSYFTLIGLRDSGRPDLVRSTVGNFSSLLRRYGLIPNGNRTYYLSRSQPPFFSLMVDLLAGIDGPGVYRTYLPALRIESDFWNDGTASTRHRVVLPDGSALDRYFDARDDPRPEAWAEDEAVAESVPPGGRPALCRDLRSAAESGWDFSTRWFGDSGAIATIRTTDLLPVDLNCLLVHLDEVLARACAEAGEQTDSARFRAAAEGRAAALLHYCWSGRDRFFVDYNWKSGGPSRQLTLAGVLPLYFKLATPAQAAAVAAVLRDRFLRPGGLTVTLRESGQQWDAPNGWAPLEWLAVRGLENYGQRELAGEIARRWLALNRAVYRRTGKLMEKYNVENLELPAGGGEYLAQDGFGWTNGVYLDLLRSYPQ